MRTRTQGMTLTEQRRYPFDHPSDRTHPGIRRAAALTAKHRAHVCQNGISQVQYRLEWPNPEDADCERPCEPSYWVNFSEPRQRLALRVSLTRPASADELSRRHPRYSGLD